MVSKIQNCEEIKKKWLKKKGLIECFETPVLENSIMLVLAVRRWCLVDNSTYDLLRKLI